VIDDDGVARGGHRPGAQVGPHVEGLELLDRIGLLRDADSAADHGIQIDEDALAEEVVDLGLTDGIPGRKPEQA
jgi:hypothetical protein